MTSAEMPPDGLNIGANSVAGGTTPEKDREAAGAAPTETAADANGVAERTSAVRSRIVTGPIYNFLGRERAETAAESEQ
jgi:hypothetical protein